MCQILNCPGSGLYSSKRGKTTVTFYLNGPQCYRHSTVKIQYDTKKMSRSLSLNGNELGVTLSVFVYQ